MSTDPRAKHPVSALAGPYGHPLHPILVTVPIGAWVASFAFDLGSRVAADPATFARGSYWLILLGLLGAAAAALIGFLDLFAIPVATKAFRTALAHMAVNLVVTAAYLANLLLRAGSSATAEVAAPLIALSGVGLLLLAVGGWLGGKLAFRYGVRVADEATQREGFTGSPHPATNPDRASQVRQEGH